MRLMIGRGKMGELERRELGNGWRRIKKIRRLGKMLKKLKLI